MESQEKSTFSYPRSRALTLSALFACILAVFSIISIPIGITQVPVTLQVFVVFLIAMILGPKLGALSCAIYLLIGAVGLPVFAGASGGLGVLFGPSGGYLIAFPVAAFLGGSRCSRRALTKRKDLVKLSLAVSVALLVIYGIGVLWLTLYLRVTPYDGLLLGAVPFVPFDVVKAIFAVPVALQLRWAGLQLPLRATAAQNAERTRNDSKA